MMKKFVFVALFLVGVITSTFSQTDTVLYVSNHPSDMDLCPNYYQHVFVYAEESCNDFWWELNGITHYENPLVIEPQIDTHFNVRYYHGCNIEYHEFHIYFEELIYPNSVTSNILKRQGIQYTIEPVGTDSLDWFAYHWSTGEITPTINVINPGVYICEIGGLCGTATRTFIVRDNVEIYRSGVDPATNKNRVLWQTTPEQAAYISNVKVERDGMVVGTVPYLDGQFLDNIGSENAARIYRITAIASDGTECPIPSYQFGTFNTIYSPDIANPNLMNFSWEDPFIEEGSPYEVIAYRIGRVDNTGEFIVIDQLSANVHLGKYDMDLFDGDYGIVAAVFNDSKRDYEELAFSNRSDNGIVGIGEQNGENFGIYPNPAKDCFTVEGTGVITVTNTLGQTILTQEIDGKATIELPQGMYFVRLGDMVRKIVVE